MREATSINQPDTRLVSQEITQLEVELVVTHPAHIVQKLPTVSIQVLDHQDSVETLATVLEALEQAQLALTQATSPTRLSTPPISSKLVLFTDTSLPVLELTAIAMEATWALATQPDSVATLHTKGLALEAREPLQLAHTQVM